MSTTDVQSQLCKQMPVSPKRQSFERAFGTNMCEGSEGSEGSRPSERGRLHSHWHPSHDLLGGGVGCGALGYFLGLTGFGFVALGFNVALGSKRRLGKRHICLFLHEPYRPYRNSEVSLVFGSFGVSASRASPLHFNLCFPNPKSLSPFHRTPSWPLQPLASKHDLSSR